MLDDSQKKKKKAERKMSLGILDRGVQFSYFVFIHNLSVSSSSVAVTNGFDRLVTGTTVCFCSLAKQYLGWKPCQL